MSGKPFPFTGFTQVASEPWLDPNGEEVKQAVALLSPYAERITVAVKKVCAEPQHRWGNGVSVAGLEGYLDPRALFAPPPMTKEREEWEALRDEVRTQLAATLAELAILGLVESRIEGIYRLTALGRGCAERLEGNPRT